jgi:uncharacterized protein YgiB involved in biofilm formation
MKRSKTITLVLLTSTLLIGCGEENMRNKYESWDDCVADYKDPSKCKREEESTTGGVRRYYYYGPWFAASRFRNSTYNPGFSGGRSIGVGVARGGFGSSGRSSVS